MDELPLALGEGFRHLVEGVAEAAEFGAAVAGIDARAPVPLAPAPRRAHQRAGRPADVVIRAEPGEKTAGEQRGDRCHPMPRRGPVHGGERGVAVEPDLDIDAWRRWRIERLVAEDARAAAGIGALKRTGDGARHQHAARLGQRVADLVGRALRLRQLGDDGAGAIGELEDRAGGQEARRQARGEPVEAQRGQHDLGDLAALCRDGQGEGEEALAVCGDCGVADGEIAADGGGADEGLLRRQLVPRQPRRAGAEDVPVEIGERDIGVALLLRRQAAERRGA